MAWESKRLDEIATIQTGPFGSQLHNKDYVDVGTPIITVEHLGQYRIRRQNMPMVTSEDANRLQKYSLLPGDIVFSRVGSVDQSSYVGEAESGWLFSGRCLRVRPDANKADPLFTYYALNTAGLKNYIRAIAVGATMPSINTAILSEIPISLPALTEQQRIATVLGSLDDKIAANIEAVRTIDCLRNALWHRNLAHRTTATPLSSLASYVNGGAFTKNATGTGRVVVRIAEMNGGIGNNTVRNELNVPETKVVRPGELLFSWSGTLMTKRWPYDEAIVNQHIFKVIPDHGFPLAFLDCAIEQQLNFFKMVAAGKATTMGHIKRSDLDAEVQIPIQFREEDLRLAESLWANASALEKENMILAKTRDELLPLLMSGKITVREAAQEAAAAGAHVQGEENEV